MSAISVTATNTENKFLNQWRSHFSILKDKSKVWGDFWHDFRRHDAENRVHMHTTSLWGVAAK